MTRRPASIILSVVFGLLALNAFGQVVSSAFDKSSDPAALIAMQFVIGLTGAATAWGSGTSAAWTWRAAIAYGVATSVMLFSLPFILHLEVEARAGIWSGAVAILLFSLACAYYFRSDARRATTPAPAGSGSTTLMSDDDFNSV